MLTDYAKAAGLLAQSDDIAILCHRSPDGDTLGCGYALCLALLGLGKRARVYCSDPIPRRYQFLADGIPQLEFAPRFVVAVDVADCSLLGSGLESYAQRVDLCIDHHPSNTGYAKQLLLEGDSAAACEVVYLLLQKLDVEVTPKIASCLYTGMTTDTGCFRYSNTTARTHRLAAQLMEKGAEVGAINKWLFETRTKASMLLKRLAEETLEFHFEDRCALIVVTQEMLAQSGALEEDLEGVSSIPRRVEGVEAGIAFRQQPDGSWRLSLRTGPSIDASRVCQTLGGGGHPCAAGCTLRCGLEEAKQTVLEALAHEL